MSYSITGGFGALAEQRQDLAAAQALRCTRSRILFLPLPLLSVAAFAPPRKGIRPLWLRSISAWVSRPWLGNILIYSVSGS